MRLTHLIGGVAKLAANLVLALSIGSPALAQGLSPDDQKALEQVQKMLTNPMERHQAISQTPGAHAAHQQATQSLGAENTEEIYAISAIVMGDLVRMSGGDAAKMQQILARAKTNPAEFYKMLSPASVDAIKKLSTKIKPKNS